jgi:hypothetical protein
VGLKSLKSLNLTNGYPYKGPCHVSGIFLPLRVNSLPLATIYEVKIPLRKWKKSLLQRNPAQMTWANNKKNKKKNNNNNKVKSKPLELFELAGKNYFWKEQFYLSKFPPKIAREKIHHNPS